MNILVIIPARGGSKGIPRKNIKPLNGKPLIYYAIDAARELFSDAQICVSTDDKEIKEFVEEYGLKVPFIRPDELASDGAGMYEVLLHAVSHYENKGISFDKILLLQPTSPFRTGTHLKEAIAAFEPELEMLVSVKETKSNPYYLLFEENEEGFLRKSKEGDFIRRQDCPKVYEYNGAIFLIDIPSLKKKPLHQFEKIKKYVMDDFSSLDLDEPIDWVIAETFVTSESIHKL